MLVLGFKVLLQEYNEESLSGIIGIDLKFMSKMGSAKEISVNKKDALGHQRFTIQIVSELVAAMVVLTSAIIVLPKIIAEYLFHASDEKNRVEIIKNMQEYDKSVRDNIKR